MRAEGVSGADRAFLESSLPFFRKLPQADRDELCGHVGVFRAEKRFEGCGGFEVTDETRLTVSAFACVLLLHRPAAYFPSLVSILVYPRHFRVPLREQYEDGVVEERMESRLGESWHRGEVILAWSEVRRDNERVADGRNIVFHEFAHQLDDENGDMNGVPPMPSKAMNKRWIDVMGREFERLNDDLDRNRSTLIDPYGAESPSEFFAVVTEAFFESPRPVRAAHPELYGLLRDYFGQDPAEWPVD